jgi:protein O-mannosyl-transferase
MKETLKKEASKKGHHKQHQQAKTQPKKKDYTNVIGLAVIILLGIIIYSNCFNCSFHFDDYQNIVNNTKIRNLSDIKAWWNFIPNRPLGVMTFVLNYHFNQLDVRYYHFVNLIIHLFNACLIWWLSLMIFSSPVMKDHPVSKHKKVIALFIALLFVSHPLATQSVTYIVQRFASMVAMFYLLSLALYMKARLTDKNNKAKYLLFAGALVSAIIAMLTKENSFTLPFAVILTEFFFLKTKKLSVNFRDYRIILLIAMILGTIIVIFFKFSFSIFDTILPTQGHTFTITPINYLFTQFTVILKYIQLLFLPINQSLDYDFRISNNFFEIRTLLSFVVLLALFILGIFFYKKQRVISFGIFWFFLTMAIESSIVPSTNVIFEHRTYLPSFGFFLILAWCIFLLPWNKYKYVIVSLLMIIIGANSVLTFQRNKVWKDEISLWNDIVDKNPDLTRALSNRGIAFASTGQFDKALVDFSKVIGIDPNSATAYNNRGMVYGNLRMWDKALADYIRAIEIDPKYATAYNNRGMAYGNLGQLDKALADFSKAIELNPNYTKAINNRELTYKQLHRE